MNDSSRDLNHLICGFSDDNHFAQEHTTLFTCGHVVCKSCMPNRQSKKCNCVDTEISKGDDVSLFNKSKIEHFLSELFKEIENKSSNKITSLKSK